MLATGRQIMPVGTKFPLENVLGAFHVLEE